MPVFLAKAGSESSVPVSPGDLEFFHTSDGFAAFSGGFYTSLHTFAPGRVAALQSHMGIDPVATRLADGGFVVAAWGGDYDTYLTVFNADLSIRKPSFIVNAHRTGFQTNPQVSALADGGFIVTWMDNDGGALDQYYGVRAAFFSSSGTKIGQDIIVPDLVGSNELRPDVAGLSNGKAVIAWEGAGGVKFQILGADGSRLAFEGTAGVGLKPEVFALNEGRFLVAWEVTGSGANYRDLVGRIFDSSGNAVSGEFQIQSAAIEDQKDLSIALLSDGGFVASWTDMNAASDGSGTSIKAQAFDRLGRKLGPELLVNSQVEGDQHESAVTVLPNGQVMIGWVDTATGQVRTQLYDQILADDGQLGTSGDDVLSAQDGGRWFLDGQGGADLLSGAGGHDYLDGGAGADVMRGGLGDDVYIVDDVSDQAIEEAGEGTDEVYTGLAGYTLGANLERLTGLSASGQELRGNALDNVITGAAGADILDGGTGADSMNGGEGSDIYFVDTAADQVFDSGGAFDALYTTVTYALRPDAAIELIAARTPEAVAGFGLYGNDFIQSLIGNNGHNALYGLGGDDGLYGYDGVDIMDGGAGADVMDGGTGGDIYFVDNIGDVVIERDGEGTDWLYSSVSYALGTGSYVENIGTRAADGTEAINLFGSDRDNTIIGNNGANLLAGGGGSDSLRGLDGDDLLDGGRGQDFLEGGAGADTFRFEFASDSALGSADAIFDFVSGTDKIDLALIDADSGAVGDQAFTFIGGSAFSGKAGELRVEMVGSTAHVVGDVNGDGVADLHIVAYNTTTLAAGDFIL